MKQSAIPMLALLICVLLPASCSKQKPSADVAGKGAQADGSVQGTGQESQLAPAPGSTGPASLGDLIQAWEQPLKQDSTPMKVQSALTGIVPVSIRGNVEKPAHQPYLEERMAFADLPPNPFPGQACAVAAADNVELFEDFLAPIQNDRRKIWEFLEKQKPVSLGRIPIGTVLPLYGVYDDPQEEASRPEYMDGLLRFRNDTNWFYRTEYQGRKGIVWGAGLRGVSRERPGNSYSGPYLRQLFTLDSQEVMRLSYYYSKPQKGEIWVPFVGSRALGSEIRQTLKDQHVAFEQTVYGHKNDYHLWLENPDDLLALYSTQKEDPTQTSRRSRSEDHPDLSLYDSNRGIPTFITTDLLAHCLHLLFDRMLTQLEEERLILTLGKLVDRLGQKARALALPDDAESFQKDAARLLNNYLAVAEALIRMAPPPSEAVDEYGGRTTAPAVGTVDTALLWGQYPSEVQRELQLINAAGEAAVSPSLFIRIDYTQFKPRGHYTKDEALQAYFRAMQWLGQAQLDIDLRRTPPKSDALSEEDLTALHGLAAFWLNKFLIEDPQAYKLWKELYDPITYLVGASDDLVPQDTIPLLQAYLSRDFREWGEKDKIQAILAEIAPQLRTPRIQGGGLLGGTAQGEEITIWTEQQGEELMPVTFRLLGPRFTLDSYFFHRLSGHRIPGKVPRNMVRGLDVMAMLGSRSAELELREERGRNPGYGAAYERLKTEVEGYPSEVFRDTYYGQCLGLIARLAGFDGTSGFFFTLRPLWDTKALLTAQAAWAELRHDTLLYTRQSAAERAGNGGYSPTYTTFDFPLQVHYIEPNIRFFYALRDILRSVQEKTRDFLPQPYALKFADLSVIVETMTGIVEKQVLDLPITEKENGFILDVPAYLSKIVLPAGVFDATENPDQLKMAIVADVHTDALEGKVLQVATGMPYRLYVALNDGQGGKRIAVGYTYSYYEFVRAADERLTDEEWKRIVYPEQTYPGKAVEPAAIVEKLRPYQPEWLRGRVP